MASFEQLLNIPKSPEVTKSIAKGFEQRQKTRESLYAQVENFHNRFNFDREYVI